MGPLPGNWLAARQNVSPKPPDIYIYSKADWDSINSKTEEPSKNITADYESGKNVEELWTMFKTEVYEIMDKFIPTKDFSDSVWRYR